MNLNSILKQLVRDNRAIFLLSLGTNVLMLASSWYMLEVYDRVLSSQNYHTLLMLSVLVLFLFLILEYFEWLRFSILRNFAHSFYEKHRVRVFDLIFKLKLEHASQDESQPLSDLKTIQIFLSSSTLLNIIDIPFGIITLFIIFYIHPLLGWITVIGITLIGFISMMNYKEVELPLKKANNHQIQALNYVNETIRHIELIRAMGMLNGIRSRWIAYQNKVLSTQIEASSKANFNLASSKFLQLIQGSSILGVACWLILSGDQAIDSSSMIIASILGGRTVSPMIGLIAQWRSISNTKDALSRLNIIFNKFPEMNLEFALPRPKGNIAVDHLFSNAPQSKLPIIKGLSFNLLAGQTLAIIGPSGSGKTTLAKLILGLWKPSQGSVRIDGADAYGWPKDELGVHIGYLSQSFDLFAGTIEENICRFGEINNRYLTEAIDLAGLTSFVASQPKGLKTEIGDGGAYLSGGQRQRIALARSIYGDPRILMLDEPNSNLDKEGEAILVSCLKAMKQRNCTIIFITHQKNMIDLADQILVLIDGQNKIFGPADEVLNAMKSVKANE